MISHFKVGGSQLLLPFLVEKLRSSADQIEFLIDFGAVYVNQARVRGNIELENGDYVRVHSNPRRFEVPAHIETIFENEAYLVINKPSGLPSHSTLDNLHENALSVMKKRSSSELYITTRLDIGTSGLLLFAKNKEAQIQINRTVLQKKMEKRYLALTERSVSLGPYVAYMEPSKRSPKRIFETGEGIKCETTIRRCDPLDSYFLLELELATGRTHQIRAHLAFLGAPIVNDILYGGVEITDLRPHPNLKIDGFNLHCGEMAFEGLGETVLRAHCSWLTELKNKNPQR